MTALLTCAIIVTAIGFAFLAALICFCLVIANRDNAIDLPGAME